MSNGYIYPSWLSAQTALVQALKNKQPDQTVASVVGEFFKRYFFEVGSSVHVSLEMFHQEKIDVEKESEHINFRAIGDRILKDGFYMRREYPATFGKEIVHSVLVFGAPKVVYSTGDKPPGAKVGEYFAPPTGDKPPGACL